MKIFVHICCAPCAVFPVTRLRSEGFAPTAFFYNPNIHPYQEFSRRLRAVREYAALTGLPVLVREDDDLDAFLVRVAGRGAGRCEQCYRMRLSAAAAEARMQGFPLYTTSLLYSRHQKHDVIRGVAQEMAQQHGIDFHYADFREGWNDGIAASKAMGLYRQQYCGCVYSERERYAGRAGHRR
jgi:predicted adenine nucleotide alpha hydrolase (AANH) superfamily ATPase